MRPSVLLCPALPRPLVTPTQDVDGLEGVLIGLARILWALQHTSVSEIGRQTCTTCAEIRYIHSAPSQCSLIPARVASYVPAQYT
jgi:hypothetical protein